MLDVDFFKDQIFQMKDHLIYLTFYFQGEPYLHDQFLEMVSYASSQNVYTSTSTNAHFLNDALARDTVQSGLDNLIVSIDGTTQETYEAYRIGGKLEKVLDGTRKVVEWKKKLKSKTPNVIFQYLVVSHNEHQISDARQLAKEIGVNEIQFKTAQIYDYEEGNELIPNIQKYSRYQKNQVGKYELKNQLHSRCWKMWHSCVVTWNGQVVPCCFDKDANHSMGDLKDSSLQDIWYSKKYNDFRKSILKSRSEIDICKNCSEGLQVFG